MPGKTRGRVVTQTCHCGAKFEARTADVARGWGKFCSKSCKGKEQEGCTHQNRNFHNTLRAYQDDAVMGHPFQSGYFGHGQE